MKAKKEFKRFICLVADGFGVGEAPDAFRYGDQGSNTLGNTSKQVGGIKLPNLEKLGLGCLGNFAGIKPTSKPLALVSRLAEKSAGKDTTSGHWEIAGLITDKPFPIFEKGFPKELVDQFVKAAQIPGVLGNCHASGTEILKQLGEEHLKTGKPILYTSGDSVFQVAAHEVAFGLKRLHEICEIARRITVPYQIGRVIARPFVGESSLTFKRTENRRDYSLTPGTTCLDVIKKNGIEVISVGKIDDIFAHRGISHGNHTGNNPDSLKATLDFIKKTRGQKAFIFVNLVDFDMLFGHRRDPVGYANALVQMDEFLPKILSELTEEDCLILTSDHGCDPTFRGSDHTREFVPLIAYSPNSTGAHLADRGTFSDIGATLIEAFHLPTNELPHLGKSFLCDLQK
ncbi:phosphopentomutase [bacterium]|nr:phosphopentomutase [bacterium]